MPRPQLHHTDTILDAARDVLLDQGVRGATMEAIADTSGAPTGTIYHRFGSRDVLLAQLWIRAVRRSQALFLAAVDQEPPRQAALAAALSIVDFCDREPAEARLLTTFRREDLMRMMPTGQVADELAALNEPVQHAVTDLAARLYGNATPATVQRTLLAVFDIPYGAVRRHVIAGQSLPPGLQTYLIRAVAAVLDDEEPSPSDGAHRT